MKKLQIPLEDELMAAAKIFALQNNTTLKEVVIQALTNYIRVPVPEPALMPKLSPTPKKTEPKPKKVELDLFDRPVYTDEEREAEVQRMIHTSKAFNPLE